MLSDGETGEANAMKVAYIFRVPCKTMARGLMPERHEQAIGKRRTMDRHRTIAAARATQAKGWSAPGAGPGRADRHHLRLQERHPLEDAAPGDGLWQRRDLLAAPARLASSRRLGMLAPGLAESARGGRPDRLEPGQPRQCCASSPKGGQATGPNPTDKGKPGSKHHLVVDCQGSRWP